MWRFSDVHRNAQIAVVVAGLPALSTESDTINFFFSTSSSSLVVVVVGSIRFVTASCARVSRRLREEVRIRKFG